MYSTGGESIFWIGVALAGLTLLAGCAGMLALATTTGFGHNLVPRTLRARLTLGLLMLALVPAVGITLSLTVRQVDQQRERAEARLLTATTTLADETDEFVGKHLAAVMVAADALSGERELELTEVERRLAQFHAVYPDLITTLVTDRAGRIVAATRQGPDGPSLVDSTDRSVADRAYFRVPMAEGRPFVSQVFRGRGLGTDPIVALSAPILRGGQRWGVLQGSLDLRAFGRLEKNHISPGSQAKFLILDQQWRVIYASAASGFAFLDDLGRTATGRQLRDAGAQTVARISLPGSAASSQSWLASRAPTGRGWTVVVANPASSVALLLARDLRTTLAWFTATAICALLMAWALLRSTTEPLRRLHTAIESFEVDSRHDELRKVRGLTREYGTLFRSLHRLSWRLRGSYERLSAALQDTKRLRDELSEVLARREEEIRQRTSQLDAANRELERLSRIDPLTGLANRRWFDEFVDQSWRVAVRERVPLTFMLIDVDHFKAYNDRYGHPAGDECLKRVAAAVRGSAGRPLDHAARYGGEEFAVVLTDASPAGACSVAERLRCAVASLAIPHAGSPGGHVSVSIGLVTLVPGADDSATEVLRRADEALYAAKGAGRNLVRVWCDGENAAVPPSPPSRVEPALPLSRRIAS
jgi:diguanylate cyclase (GGDEF)-like protein